MPRQHVENTKEFWSENEAKRANKHANKRIIYWPPFWNKVYWSRIDHRWKFTCNFCVLDSNFSSTTNLSSLYQPISCWFACWCCRIPYLSYWEDSNTGTTRRQHICLVTISSLCVLYVSAFPGSYLSWTRLHRVLTSSARLFHNKL